MMENILAEIKDLVRNDKLDEALELCALDKYKDNESIQAERIFILTTKKKDFSSAYNVWRNYKDSNYLGIVINGINTLIKLNAFEKAYEYANAHQFDDIKYMRIRARLLALLNKHEELLEIRSNPKYAFDDVITRIYKKSTLNVTRSDNISTLLTKLYVGNLSVDEINSSPLDYYSKSLLLLAYYEKYNSKSGIDLVKIIKKNDMSDDYKKIYNIIEQRLLKKKNKYFDISFYTDLLKRDIDFDLANKLQNERVEVKPVVNDNIKKSINIDNNKKTSKVSEKKPSKYVEIVGNRVNSRYSNNSNSKVNDNNSSYNNNRTLLIKDVLSSEINELGMYLYVMMQDSDIRKDAIKAWDNLENIAYKPVTDTKALEKIVNILIKVSHTHPEIVNADNKKLMKLLKN